jgi:hypothetical protein
MNQLIIPLKIRLINWWLIALALLEIFFGLGIFWIPANWNGDYMPAGLILLFISLIGIFTLISSIFLLMRKKWAWMVCTLMLLLAIFIAGNDYAIWLSHNGGIGSFFDRIFGYRYDFPDVLYASIIVSSLIISLLLILIYRNRFGFTFPLSIWWLVVIAFFEIFFGIILNIDMLPGIWLGFQVIASVEVLVILITGIVMLISSIFLLKQKRWAWLVSILTVVLATIIMGYDYGVWLNGGFSPFRSIFGYSYNFQGVLYHSIVIISLLIALGLLLANRKKLADTTPVLDR